MRHTRAHSKNRRSHHALKVRGTALCEGCGAPKMRHRACSACGVYRDRQVLDMGKNLEKKTKAQQAQEEEAK